MLPCGVHILLDDFPGIRLPSSYFFIKTIESIVTVDAKTLFMPIEKSNTEDLDEAILDNEVCSQNMNGDCYEEIMKIMRKLRKEIKSDSE